MRPQVGDRDPEAADQVTDTSRIRARWGGRAEDGEEPGPVPAGVPWAGLGGGVPEDDGEGSWNHQRRWEPP
ncbi:MAG TPA: hypothetical protein VH092_00595 [Urbifossiella sp.]|nr:hypothetical protein [Urbifossiella sp.]